MKSDKRNVRKAAVAIAMNKRLWEAERREAKHEALQLDRDITDKRHREERRRERREPVELRAELDEAAWQDYRASRHEG